MNISPSELVTLALLPEKDFIILAPVLCHVELFIDRSRLEAVLFPDQSASLSIDNTIVPAPEIFPTSLLSLPFRFSLVIPPTFVEIFPFIDNAVTIPVAFRLSIPFLISIFPFILPFSKETVPPSLTCIALLADSISTFPVKVSFPDISSPLFPFTLSSFAFISATFPEATRIAVPLPSNTISFPDASIITFLSVRTAGASPTETVDFSLTK